MHAFYLLHEFQNIFKCAVFVSIFLKLAAYFSHYFVLLLIPRELVCGKGLLVALQPCRVLNANCIILVLSPPNIKWNVLKDFLKRNV